MENRSIIKVKKLVDKGVKIPCPESVEIGDDVKLDNISGQGVAIHSGCRIFGSSTYICNNARLGYEGPVTVENCQIGPNADIRGGFFKKAVFLKKASVGYGCQVRQGTIVEEESSVAHCVGLKQTILFPFVTLGSLVNFCDCLMSGGTGKKDHSEVGSSYIHFNFTPNQDKATPSLIGDVPKGVMLNQKPIFLGGQGGLVGPCRLAFGVVIAAGTIYRKDELRSGRLLIEGSAKRTNIPYEPGDYQNYDRILKNNVIYIANLIALIQWYIHIRSMFISDDFPKPLLKGLKDNIKIAVDERIRRLDEFCNKASKKNIITKRPVFESSFLDNSCREGDKGLRDSFIESIESGIKINGKDYISVIKGLSTADSRTGTSWLQGIVDKITNKLLTKDKR